MSSWQAIEERARMQTTMPRPCATSRNGKARPRRTPRSPPRRSPRRASSSSTPTGEGKSTAAVGLSCVRWASLALRRRPIHQALGHWRAAADCPLPDHLPGARWRGLHLGASGSRPGHGCGGGGFGQAQELHTAPEIKLLLLDQLNITLRYDYLLSPSVAPTLPQARPI